LPGIIFDPDGAERAVSLEGVEERSFRGRAVLVRTGWDARWGATSGASTTREKLSRPAHTGLLAAGIPIVENLRGLERLPRGGIVFSAPPIAIVRGAAFPVRAFAEVP